LPAAAAAEVSAAAFLTVEPVVEIFAAVEKSWVELFVVDSFAAVSFVAANQH